MILQTRPINRGFVAQQNRRMNLIENWTKEYANVNLIVPEQYLPDDIRVLVKGRKPTTCVEAVELADNADGE